MRSEEIQREIKRLEEEEKSTIIEIEKKRIRKKRTLLEKELYGMKQKEYVKCSDIDEKTYKERIEWLEESKRVMRMYKISIHK